MVVADLASVVPALQEDLVRVHLGSEAVVWSPLRARPVALDPVETVMLDVVDGTASIATLAQEVHEVVGLPFDQAVERVQRVVERYAAAGLLTDSEPHDLDAERSPFASPISWCIESSSCTGRMTSVSLEIGGLRFRVASTSRRVTRRLRAALDPWVVDDEAPLGFAVRRRSRRRAGLEVVDRGGFLLGTASGSEGALAVLGSHLSALCPPSAGHVRLRARAAVKEGHAVLLVFPLLFVPTLEEELIGHYGAAVVDALVVDLEVSTGRLVLPAPMSAKLGSLTPPRAHAEAGDRSVVIDRVVYGVPSGAARPTPAQAVADLAGELLAGTEQDAVDVLSRLVGVDSEKILAVDPSLPGASWLSAFGT
jgi:hypothetical protein